MMFEAQNSKITSTKFAVKFKVTEIFKVPPEDTHFMDRLLSARTLFN